MKSKYHKGRGAIGNPDCRYQQASREDVDDGWHTPNDDAHRPRTVVYHDASKSIITRNNSPDVPFEQSINAYRGCEHGCVYCFARPTHAYLDLSPGLDFETKLFAKPDAPQLLRKELARPAYKCKTIAMGTNTDPYQPIERDYTLTRQILTVLRECRHPVSIVTKSALIERDIDILAEMAQDDLVEVMISLATLEPKLARHMEPRAVAPRRRLETLARLNEAGVPTGVLVAPMIPVLADQEMEAILEACHAGGARRAGYVLLRLPLEVAPLFEQWLQHHYPLKAAHVMGRIYDARGGKAYESGFGRRMHGRGAYAQLIGRRFDAACKRLGFNQRSVALRTDLFRAPAVHKKQLNLF
jgi:DNA repair photolyase